MSEMRINQEALPVRCEICHQSDLFDGVTGFCGRCVVVQDKVQRLCNIVVKCHFWSFLTYF
jgi:hypothetical protein